MKYAAYNGICDTWAHLLCNFFFALLVTASVKICTRSNIFSIQLWRKQRRIFLLPNNIPFSKKIRNDILRGLQIGAPMLSAYYLLSFIGKIIMSRWAANDRFSQFFTVSLIQEIVVGEKLPRTNGIIVYRQSPNAGVWCNCNLKPN